MAERLVEFWPADYIHVFQQPHTSGRRAYVLSDGITAPVIPETVVGALPKVSISASCVALAAVRLLYGSVGSTYVSVSHHATNHC